MKKIFINLILILIFVSVANLKVSSQTKNRILFIFDESYSMTGYWENNSKIEIAKDLLIKMVDSLSRIKNVELALRMYGHQSPSKPQDCSDTKLVVPFAPNNTEKIKFILKTTVPKGTTPIARSLEECADDFPPCVNCRNVVILITDGIEACDGDPCAVAMSLFSKGITLKPFVIGIGLDVEFKDAFECIGQYYNATKEDEFGKIMKDVVSKAIMGTTCQINLLDTQMKPTETNVSVTLFDQKTGKPVTNFVHTLNYKNLPDTISIDESVIYKMTVHTIPEVTVENIKIQPRTHNIISAYTPQGKLNIIQNDGLELSGTHFIVRKQGSMQTLNIQEVFEPQNYITGLYDIEVFTLPRTYFKNIEINQSTVTTVKIERPGTVNFTMPAAGFGGIYKVENNQVVLIKNFDFQLKQSYFLQPGNYIAVWRDKNAKLTGYSKEKYFTVRSGLKLNIVF